METETKAPDIVVTEDAPEQQPAPVATPTETPAKPASTPATDTMPAWAKAIEDADAATLRKHPKIAGMIGSEAQRLYQLKGQQDHAAESQRVHEATEAELLKFSEDNADYLKENYPRAYQHLITLQQDRAKRDMEGLHGKTLHDLAQKVGASIQQLPEYTEFTQADHDRLVQALVGKSDDEVLAIYNLTALDIAANKRLAKLLAKETEKIRGAVRQEEAARLMKDSDAPDLAKPKATPGKVNIPAMTDDEFTKWYETNVRKT